MTLKEQLEILRGEPIQVFEGDPKDIPCIETSDAEKLCKNPVVSVHMITYNHEPYIRQSIEGVMMQKTDFEFELIIGEDCSQDKTREICFEYQKKYPDRIRVLWWHENVSKLGGNSRRVFSRCRGEFIALCEGDDYWTDPLKLQKQVDIMRKYPDVGLCFCGASVKNLQTLKVHSWETGPFIPGKISRDVFFNIVNHGMKEILTATAFVRKTIYVQAVKRHEIFNWRLWLGDTTLWLGLASFANVYFLPDEVATYHRGGNGLTSLHGTEVSRDGIIVRLFFLVYKKRNIISPSTSLEHYVLTRLVLSQVGLSRQQQQLNYLQIIRNNIIKGTVLQQRNFGVRICWENGWIRSGKMLVRYLYYRDGFVQKLFKRIRTFLKANICRK